VRDSGPAGVLWAPTSEGSGAERVGFECIAGAGLGIVVLPVEGDGDSSEAHAPCTGHGGWVPVRNWTGCKWTDDDGLVNGNSQWLLSAV